MARGLQLFKSAVRPVLIEQCVKCHGGDKIRSEFDLTTREGLIRGGTESAGIVVGDHQASFAYQVMAHLQEPHMPHKRPKLADQILGPNRPVDRLGRPLRPTAD